MKKVIEELKKIIKDKGLDETDFNPVFDILVSGAEESEKIAKEKEELIKENAEKNENIEKIAKEKEELDKKIVEKEKELAELKIKYIERFSEGTAPEIKNETKEDITIKELFEEV